MIDQYAGARVQLICDSVVRDEPARRTLRCGVGTVGREGRLLIAAWPSVSPKHLLEPAL